MTFLNATLVFGTAAIAIPLLLHLIARRQPKTVIFPSVRFLTKRFESNRSRVRVRRWWLLALRIAAVAAFALALARPAIDRSLSVTWLTIGLVAVAGVALLVMATIALSRGQPKPLIYGLTAGALVALVMSIGWGGYTFAAGPKVSTEQAAPVALAIVIDNGPTTAWKSASDDRTARIADLATWMVTRLPVTSRIAIIDRSAQPASFSLDLASAVSKIEAIKPLQVTQPIETRIDAAIRLVRTSDLTSRQVLVVSDLSTSTWEAALAESSLSALLSETPEVAVTLFDLGEFDKPNRTLSKPKLSDTTPPKDEPVAISTTLRWEGAEPGSTLSVAAELQLYDNDPALPVVRDGKIRRPRLRSVDRTSVQIAAGGSSRLLMTVPPLKSGTHHGRIRLVGDDPMALDDVRYFSVRVLEPEPVLIVCDDADDARVMQLAMSEEFAVERIGFDDLPVVRLADYRAVFVMDPPGSVLSDTALEDYLVAGGGLFVCLGPAAGDGKLESPFLPTLRLRWRVTSPGTFLKLAETSHPLLEPLAEVDGGVPWSSYRVLQYWTVEPKATAERGRSDRVLATFVGEDHPALIERLFMPQEDDQANQPGRLVLMTTPIPALGKQTRSWNELFSSSDAWPAFLLTRQFPEYLTRHSADQSMTMVGRPQLVRIETPKSDDENAPNRLQLFPPGDSAPVPLDLPPGATEVAINEVATAGNYWLRGRGIRSGFAANLDPAAISTQRVEQDQLEVFFGPDHFNVATDREGIELAESQSQARVSLQSPVMLLALIAFLLEQILGNRFYGRASRQTSSGSGAVSPA